MFKLIPHDVGLLGCMLDLPPSVLMSQDFGMAKGYFAEVYVAQAILAASPADKDQQLYGWSEGESEIEFLVSSERGPVPVEVKSGRRTKARSLGQYISKYKPEFAICLSMKPWSWAADRRLLNLPLPLAHCIGSLTPILLISPMISEGSSGSFCGCAGRKWLFPTMRVFPFFFCRLCR